MSVFAELNARNGEDLHFFQHRESGLGAILAIHDTTLGPAAGCVRFQAPTEEVALVRHACRLAEKTTLSAALYGCDLGGGAIIVRGVPEQFSETCMRALGAFLHGLHGRFYAFIEPGFPPEALAALAKETPFLIDPLTVEAVSEKNLVSRGILLAIKASFAHLDGHPSLEKRRVAIQGVSGVGGLLIPALLAEGARVVVSDPSFERVSRIKFRHPEIEMIVPSAIASQRVDLFILCLLGDGHPPLDLAGLSCRVLACAVENPALDEAAAELLHQRGITFLPDFLLQAGQLISLDSALVGNSAEMATRRVEATGEAIRSILEKAKAEGVSLHVQARRQARERMASIRTLRKIHRPHVMVRGC